MNMRGVALVTALLVVAIASLATTALLSTSSLALHRTEALRDSEAAWWVARGVEGWVLGILHDDKDLSYDGLDEPWAQPVDALPIDQGYLHGHIVDLQGRFNLNNLLLAPTDKDYQHCRDHFRNLLNNLSPDLHVPPGLFGAIVDWADADQKPTPPEGAEDDAYQALDPPYRTANRPYTVVSELLAVKGMTPDIYEALSPLVAALPAQSQATAINVNTAPLEVLLAMPGANASEVQSFVQNRKDKPAHSEAAAKAMFGGNAPPSDVRTSYFQIQGEVFVGSSRVALYSLINRSVNKTTILAHSAEAE